MCANKMPFLSILLSPVLGPSSDAITTKDVLRNTSTFLEGLKNVCEASEILGPLKAICGVLKIATDTAVVSCWFERKSTLIISDC
jgi:hypothetical protein